MDVLILHQHFKTPASGGAIRSYYLAKALVERGHKPVVITANNQRYQFEKLEGIDVHYLSVDYDNRYGFYARGWAFVKYLLLAARLAARLPRPKICYAISVPITIGWVARWLRWRHGIPFIFEVGDLWPDAPVQMGFVKNYVLQRILYRLERNTYRAAESIVALSPAIAAAIQKKVPDKLVHVIPNMADCEFYQPTSKDPLLVQRFGLEGKLVVSYLGAVGVANGLDYLLECANAVRKAQLPVHFIIGGDGALLDRLKNNAVQLGLIKDVQTAQGEWLTFLPFTNRKGIQEIMNVTDVVFVSYKPVPILETGSPNKYFDGLAAGKMIVINFGGWIKKDIEETGCGFFVSPQRPTEFVSKMAPFIHDKSLLLKSQQAARDLALRKYSRVKLAEEWRTVLSKHQHNSSNF